MFINYFSLLKDSKKAIDTKEICWKLDLVGPVGETILHIAMLKGQNDIVKKLLQFFPKMVNDIYMGSEYYGEK